MKKMALYSFAVESMIHSFHEYKYIWENPNVEDYLSCKRKIGNPHDTHAVAIKGSVGGDTTGAVTTVGHIPRKISVIRSIFIRRGGSVTCVVNGSHHHSADLPQGRLEIPCILQFMAKMQSEAAKTETLLISALNIRSTEINEDLQMTSSSESGSDVKDHVAVLEIYDVVLKSEAIARPTVDLTDSAV